MEKDFLRFIAFVLVIMSLSAQARSQSVLPSPSTEAPVVASDDKIARIEKIMELFYVVPKLRTPLDTAEIKDGVLHISQWRGLPPDPSPTRIECIGYQWLLTGRGKKIGDGVAAVFKENPEIQKVTLDFIDVETSLRSDDKRGKFEKVMKKRRYLTMTASRTAFQNFSYKTRALKATLQKNTNECLRIGRSFNIEKDIQL